MMALRRMVLRDFLLVPALALELQAGFTVLTGETGAGKSILIDAMQLALGARGESGLVRDGAQRAEIVVEFDLPDAPAHPLRGWLDEHGFEADDALMLRRTVDVQGKSRCWINGSVATVGQLHALGEMLVDIHGQHAWQSLMRPHSMRGLLDGFAGVDPAPTEAAWQAWREAQSRLEAAKGNLEQLRQDRERLQWQIDEMAKLAPAQDEWDNLNAQHTRLTHMQDLQHAASQAWLALDGAEGVEGALAALQRATTLLAAHRDIEPEFAALEDALAQISDPLHDVARSLRDYAQAQDWDPADLDALDARVGQWLGLARRHRRPPEELHGLWQQWQQELQALDAGIDLEALQQAEAQARQHYDAHAKALSKARRAAAPRLAQAVNQALALLGMAGDRFAIGVQPLPQPQAHGVDDVQFTIAGHAGGTARPLAKVASGGELSRVSLAIAVCTSRLGQAATLVFDEVDAGIGGAVAHSVGRLLAQLGQDRQVLAVTHLPQVAACASHQFVVHKEATGGGARSRVTAVSGAARVEEIARMLGSESPTEATLAHAQEMLQHAGAAPALAAPATEQRAGSRPRRRTPNA